MSGWVPEGTAAAIPWPSLSVVVCGAGISGTAAAEVLLRRGSRVTVIDVRPNAHVADALSALGAVVLAGHDATQTLPDSTDLVITSPGWRPDHKLLATAVAQGTPVWGEVELAWRCTPPSTSWLAVTGTNGKTTTTEMLAAMLGAAGLPAAAAGNIGAPAVAAVHAAPPAEWLAVELSSFQLHWSPSVAPAAAALLNIAPDHLDWHGDFAAYAATKRGLLQRVPADGVAVVSADDAEAAQVLPTVRARHVRVTAGEPAAGELGVVAGVLVDRAFADGEDLCDLSGLAWAAPHNVTNALAAAALARCAGVAASAIGAALSAYRTGAHRLAVVAESEGVRFVDDSKATNPHAAGRALAAYESVVWIAGGLNKGLAYDDLVAGAAPRLRAAVLIGSSRVELRDAFARHAPDVPVVDAESLHTAVVTAHRLARAGDTVLLAPAAASMDMFRDYAERGAEFARAVHEVLSRPRGAARR